MSELATQTMHVVARELAATLADARTALEASLERPEEHEPLERVAELSHQAQGVLRVIEVFGGALLAEEMEHVARYMVSGRGDARQRAEGLDALMRAAVQLPNYLERVLGGGRDFALVLLPLVNDMRAVRGGSLLSEGTLLSLNLTSEKQPEPQPPPPGEPPLNAAQWARRLRPRYQAALLGLLRDEHSEPHLAALASVAEHIERSATTQPAFQLWWVTGALIEALRSGGLELNATVKRLLGQTDRELRRLFEQGEGPYSGQAPPLELLNNLLYYVARAPATGSRVAAVRASFRLAELLPVDEAVEHERESLSAPSVRLMKTVAAAIKEDLARVKDALDIFMRKGGQPEELAPHVDLLKKIGDTLAVLGLGSLRERVQGELGRLGQLARREAPLAPDSLLDVAAALISVEDSLDDSLVQLIMPLDAPSLAEPQDPEFRQVTEAVLRECTINLARIKEAVAQALQPAGDMAGLDAIPQLARGITAGLLMLGKGRAVEVMDRIGRHVVAVLSPGRTRPAADVLDRLADAVVSVEYYMETLQAGRADPWYMLDNAERCLQSIDTGAAAVPAVPAAPLPAAAAEKTWVIDREAAAAAMAETLIAPAPSLPAVAPSPPEQPAAPPPAAPVVEAAATPAPGEGDPELLALFIEEARDEIQTLSRLFPLWDENPADAESLGRVRRSFHTLKGSGRMVGARAVGDFAWAVENLLNRLIDGTRTRSAGMMATLRAALAAIPQLIDQLESGAAPSQDVDSIAERCRAYAEGREPLAVAAVRPPQVRPAAREAAHEPTMVLHRLDEAMVARMLESVPAMPVEPPVAAPAEASAPVEPAAAEVAAVEAAPEPQAVAVPSPPPEVVTPALEPAVEAGSEAEPEQAELAEATTAVEPEAVSELPGEPLVVEAGAAEAPEPVSPDVTLREIYRKEVESHIEVVREFLRRAAESPAPHPVTEALYRACHTLWGASRTAEASQSIRVAEPLHRWMRRMFDNDRDLDARGLAVIGDAAAVFDDILGHLDDTSSHFTNIPDLVARIRALDADLERSLAAAPVAAPVVGLAAEAPVPEQPSVEVAAGPLVAELPPAGPSPAEITAEEEWAPSAEAELVETVVLEPTVEELSPFAAEPVLVDVLAEGDTAPPTEIAATATEVALVEPEEPAFAEDSITLVPIEEPFEYTEADAGVAMFAGEPAEVAVEPGAALAPPEAGDWTLPAEPAAAAEAEPTILSQAEAGVAPEPSTGGLTEGIPYLPSVATVVIEDLTSGALQETELLPVPPVEELTAAATAPATAESLEEGTPVEPPATIAVVEAPEPAAAVEPVPEVGAPTAMPEVAAPSVEPAMAAAPAATAPVAPHEPPAIPGVIVEAVPASAIERRLPITPTIRIATPTIRIVMPKPPTPPPPTPPEAAQPAAHVEAPAEPVVQPEVSREAIETPAAVEPAAAGPTPVEHVEFEVEELGVEPAPLEPTLFETSAAAAEPTTAAVVEFEVEQGDTGPLPVGPAVAEAEAATFEGVAAEPVATEAEAAAPAAAVIEVAPVERVPPTPAPEPPAAVDVTPAVVAQEPAAAEADDEFDPDIAAIFCEEATELLEAADGALGELRLERGSREGAIALQRALHTIKGGARMAGIRAMGDLSHELESLLIQAGAGMAPLDDRGLEVMQASLDELGRMRDHVIAGRRVPPARDLITRVRLVARGAAAPAVAAEAPAPTPAVEHAAPAVVEPVAEAAALAPEPEPALVPAEPTFPAAEAEAPAATADTGTFEAPSLPPQAPAEAYTATTTMVLPGRESATDRAEMARVDAELLDRMLNDAGEISIFRSRLEQQLSSIEFNLGELGRVVQRLKEQLRKLEIETETQILHRHVEEAPRREDFDPLELDRYSVLQQYSRALAETASDVGSVQSLLENLTREGQNLLTQQGRVVSDLQGGLMRTRMVPFQRHVQRLTRLVRQSAAEAGKKVELVVTGAAGELDRQVLERMLPPFEHMLRNAVIHGIEAPEERVRRGKPEAGRLEVNLKREGAEVVVTVSDDGGGIDLKAVREKAVVVGLLTPKQEISDEEALQLILEPGFSTANRVTQSAGRGVGMDVVATEVKRLGGALFTESQYGRGTRFTIRLPFTLAIGQALVVRLGEEFYALPLPTVEGVVRMPKSEVLRHLSEDAAAFEYAGQRYRFQHLGMFIGAGPSQLPEHDAAVPVILVRAGENSTALVTDELLGSREIVVKSVGPQVAGIRGISGATILGDGRICIILDIGALVRADWRGRASAQVPRERTGDQRVFALVVDDSITVRRVTQRLLERNGMRVVTARDGLDAVAAVQEQVPDVILLDIEMPRMDGYEFASHVRNDPRLKDVPIVMITSRAGEKHRARAIELGVDEYLGKPYQESQLLEAIEPLVRRRRGRS